MNRREWEFKMKRDLIADAAVELFTEKGVEQVTLAEIVAKVGYSKSSLYSYFKSREDIILYIIDLADEEFNEIERFVEDKLKDVGMDELVDTMFADSTLKKYRGKKIARLFHKNISLLSSVEGKIFNKLMDIFKRRVDWLSALLMKYSYSEQEERCRVLAYMIFGMVHGSEHYIMFENESLDSEEVQFEIKKALKKLLSD